MTCLSSLFELLWVWIIPFRDALMVIQLNVRAFFSVRTWPWMMMFYKLRPLLKSAQVEKELAALKEDFAKLKEQFERLVYRFKWAAQRQISNCIWCLRLCPSGLRWSGGRPRSGRWCWFKRKKIWLCSFKQWVKFQEAVMHFVSTFRYI